MAIGWCPALWFPCRIAMLCFGCLAAAEDAAGQTAGTVLDVTVGMGYGVGGDFVDRRGGSVTSLLAFRAEDSG